MAIAPKMQDALNEHLNQEFFASYLYLSMAAFCDTINLPGFANWMRVQSKEEYEHAMKLFNYILDRDGRVTLSPIGQPQVEFDSALGVMETTLEHEQEVTTLINNLYRLAVEEGDYATQVQLQWFIAEQVEEEKIAKDIVEHLKMFGQEGEALMLMDRQLGARTPVPAPPA